MRCHRAQRRRSRTWWGVCLFVLLATGAYLAFDVLDLDGSDLGGRPASGTAAAEPARSEAEGRLRLDPTTPEDLRPLSAVFGFQVAALHPGSAPRAAIVVVFARRDRSLARAQLGRAAIASDSQPADPA